jgi:hypothetical protein
MEGQTFGVIGARELQNAAELALFISTVRKHFFKFCRMSSTDIARRLAHHASPQVAPW